MKPTLNILLAIICLQGLAIPTMQGYAAMQRHDYLAYALHAISIGINAVFAAINIASAVRKLRDENASLRRPAEDAGGAHGKQSNKL